MNILGQPAGGSPLDFATYGIAGLIIVAFLLGWLWPKPAVDQMRADKERAEKQRDDLYAVMEQKVVPALLESTTITSAMKPVMEQVVKALDAVRPAAEPQGGRDA